MVMQTVREAIRDAMAEEMRADEKVFLMGEEVADYQGAYKCSAEMVQEFGPDRVVDTPIAELGFTGIAVGAAFKGLRPIVEYMTWNFAMLATDHIINSAAKTLYMSGGKVSCPIVFRGLNGMAAHVAAQHSQDYASWYMNVPGLKVVAPSNAADAKGLLKAAIRDNNPVVVLEHEVLYGLSGEVPEGDHVVPIGKAHVARAGSDVVIFAYSMMVVKALEAAEQLAAQGIEAEVVDLRSLRPLDVAAIVSSVEKCHRAVVLEENWAAAGVGAEIMAVISDNCWDALDAPVKRMSQLPVPLPYAANLETLCVPQVEDIVESVSQLVNGG
ncbi:MAG: pyruvate dehydrogenase complex E1 component subunit beta [Alphaproteobacteria bacterium CG_4_10_14_0_8_um_filter_53_9]|nr:MAG: pyruvate dehydrogenase complex E1 component subunit beta [Alphaproteobacteria bacterium CG_4_10_14_0_8_um_filter_53_9]